MRQVLAFVVGGAACKERAALNARFKWRCFPQLEGLRRLHVIVAIDQEMRAPSSVGTGVRCPRDHNGVAFGRAEPGLQTDVPAMSVQPFSACLQIAAMLALS